MGTSSFGTCNHMVFGHGNIVLLKRKVKDGALDFKVQISNADLRFMVLQPGSAMGGGQQGSSLE